MLKTAILSIRIGTFWGPARKSIFGDPQLLKRATGGPEAQKYPNRPFWLLELAHSKARQQNMRFTMAGVGIFVFLGSKICVLQRGAQAFLCSWEAKYVFYNGGRRYFCVPGKQNMRFTTGGVGIFVF